MWSPGNAVGQRREVGASEASGPLIRMRDAAVLDIEPTVRNHAMGSEGVTANEVRF